MQLSYLMRIDSICPSKNITLPWVGPLLLFGAEIERVPHAIPGVYLLQLFDRHTGTYPAVYVGKSADLRSRLHQHADTRSTSPDVIALRSLRGSYFSAAPVLPAALRSAVESALIQLLRPACNRQVPKSSPVFPNLPPWVLFHTSGEMHVCSDD
jgi:hypothetical protein